MNPFAKQSRLERLAHTVGDVLDRPAKGTSAAADRLGVPRSTAAKAGLVASAAAGLTAVSAGISSLRRAGGAKDDS